MAPEVDGNFQEMSVHDKENAALPPTEEGQDMSRLNRVVVPMPQFVDPYDPRAQAGSINMSLDDHPMEHSEDYGGGTDYDQEIDSPENVGLRTTTEASDKPVSEWSKSDFKNALRSRGLPVSGNMDELSERWEDSEAQEAEYKEYNASDWHDDIDKAESTDDLASLRAAYDRSDADFSTVEQHFEEKKAELDGSGDNDDEE